ACGALSAFAARSAFASPFGSPFGARSAFGGLACLSSSAIDLNSGKLGEAHLAALRALADELEPDPGRLLRILGIGQRDVGQVNRRLLGDDAALLLRGLTLVALHHVDTAHQSAALRRAHLDHLAGAALVAPGEHDHLVAFLDLRRHHSTSGASEMIFMWFLA